MPCCKIGLEFGKCALHNNIKFRARKAYWYIPLWMGDSKNMAYENWILIKEHGICETCIFIIIKLTRWREREIEKKKEKRKRKREIVLIVFRVSFIFFKRWTSRENQMANRVVKKKKKKKHLGNLHKWKTMSWPNPPSHTSFEWTKFKASCQCCWDMLPMLLQCVCVWSLVRMDLFILWRLTIEYKFFRHLNFIHHINYVELNIYHAQSKPLYMLLSFAIIKMFWIYFEFWDDCLIWFLFWIGCLKLHAFIFAM